jgi:hypothetical protein
LEAWEGRLSCESDGCVGFWVGRDVGAGKVGFRLRACSGVEARDEVGKDCFEESRLRWSITAASREDGDANVVVRNDGKSRVVESCGIGQSAFFKWC